MRRHGGDGIATDLIEIPCVGAAAAAPIMPRACFLRESKRAASGNLLGHARDCLWRSGTAAHDNDRPASGVMSERTEGPNPTHAGRHEMRDLRPLEGGRRRDPHSVEDKTHRNFRVPADRVARIRGDRTRGHGRARCHRRRRAQGFRPAPRSPGGTGVDGHALLLRKKEVTNGAPGRKRRDHPPVPGADSIWPL